MELVSGLALRRRVPHQTRAAWPAAGGRAGGAETGMHTRATGAFAALCAGALNP